MKNSLKERTRIQHGVKKKSIRLRRWRSLHLKQKILLLQVMASRMME